MHKAKKAAFMGIMTALAFGLSYIEVLIPFASLGIPGVKLGLANLVVMFALYTYGVREAAVISAIRIGLSFFLFGSVTSLLYSVAGGVLSLVIMLLLYKREFFSETGVSVAGAVAHNLGQIICAVLILGSSAIWSYFPILLLAALTTGVLNGVLLKLIRSRLGKTKTIE